MLQRIFVDAQSVESYLMKTTKVKAHSRKGRIVKAHIRTTQKHAILRQTDTGGSPMRTTKDQDAARFGHGGSPKYLVS